MNINLHIERLIIDEALLGSGQRDALHAAVAAELSHLLTAGQLPAGWLNGAAIPALPGGSLAVGSAGNPAQLGAQIGQAVYSAMSSPVAGLAR